MKIKIWCLLLVSCAGNIAYAQQPAMPRQLMVRAECLYSTHATTFWGASVEYAVRLNRILHLGVGAEYAACPYHDDNGYDLYRLRFAPVYVSEYIHLTGRERLQSYLHLQQGVSFVNYNEEPMQKTSPMHHVKEKGFYGAAALGVSYPVAPHIAVMLEAGLKGFHLSGNDLDVNPHGFMSRAGLQYRF